MKKERARGGIVFTKTSKTALLREDENKKPIFEEHVRTLSISRSKDKKKFIIYEMRRKKPPKRILTMRAKKGMRRKHVIQQIKKDEFKIKFKDTTTMRTATHTTKISQTNYIAKIKAFPQVVGLVRVSDTKRKLTDYFIGYSEKIPTAKPTDSELRHARNQVMDMAIAKFINVYGFTTYEDIETEIIEERYQYYKKTFR